MEDIWKGVARTFFYLYNPMAKATYYFSHDYDPTGDPKMQAMIGEYGGLGYGIFWRMVEMLHADNSHKLPLKKFFYTAISGQMKTTPEIVEKLLNDCIDVFELFLSDGSFFWSNRVYRNIEDRENVKKIKSNAGRIGGIKSGESRKSKQNEANASSASQSGSKSKQHEAVVEANEPNEAKERKGKESINNSLSNGNGIYADILPPMSKDDFILFQSKLIKDDIFIKPLMMTRGIRDDTVMLNWIACFNVHIAGEGKMNKDYSEYRRHFKNWIILQDTSVAPKIIKMNTDKPKPIAEVLKKYNS